MKLFNLDSPLMQALSRVADIMLLNVLTFICCIPIVTAGASFTAMHYMCLKMVRNEETYLVRGFFKSFKENFGQATVIWLIQLVVFFILGYDFFIMYTSEEGLNIVLQVLIFIVTILALLTFSFVYPVLARFVNTVPRTIKNALFVSIMQLPKAILNIILSAVPIFLVLYVPQVIPLVLFFGFTLPAYLHAKLYNKFFKKLEDRVMEEMGPAEPVADPDAEDERIFKDELDPALQSIRDDNN